MDFGSPVASPNPVGSGIQTLSGLLGVKQQQQALQTGALQQQGIAADVQQRQQQNQELQALSQFTRSAAKDSSFHKQDGSLDVEKFQRGASAVAPVYGQAYIGQATSNANAMLDNRKALLGLSNEQRKTVGSYFGAVAANPNATREDFLNAADQARGVSDDPQYQRAVDRMLMSAPNTRDMATAQSASVIRQHARGIAMETNAPDTAESGPAVQMVQGQGGLVPTNVNPQAPGGVGQVGPTQSQGLAPGFTTFGDQAGNTWAVNPQQPGHAILVGQGGSLSGGGPAPSGSLRRVPDPQAGGGISSPGGSSVPNRPQVMGIGQAENTTTSALNDEQTYTQVRNAANKAPQVKNILNSIQMLADQSKTGAGSKEIANAEAVISQYLPGFKAAGDAATNRQLLGKYVEQLAMQTAEGAGLSTDAARAQVATAIPDPEHMTPDAIKKAAQFIQSQTQVAQARGAVAEKYRQEHGGLSQGLRAVDSTFMQHMDPRAFDYISLPKEQRAAFLQQHFPTPDARQQFAQQLSVIDHYGGFNYAR